MVEALAPQVRASTKADVACVRRGGDAPLAACAAGADATTSPKPKAMTMRHAILRLLQTGTEGRPKHGINEA